MRNSEQGRFSFSISKYSFALIESSSFHLMMCISWFLYSLLVFKKKKKRKRKLIDTIFALCLSG